MSVSRLMLRLERQIAYATDPCVRECLKAERAGALARLGRLEEARQALAEVRVQSHYLAQPVLDAWVELVEGMVQHFESLSPQARERFLRARALAEKAGKTSVQALAAAWVAISCFNGSEYRAMAHHLREALRLAGEQDHATRARSSLVLLAAYQAAGDEDSARHWFEQARRHAAAEGDVSMLGMAMHNMASARVDQITLEHALGRCDEAAARQILLEVESGANLDTGLGVLSLGAVVPIMRARLLLMVGRHAEALELFDAHLAQACNQGMQGREARLRADRAWSLWQVGRIDEALVEAQWAENHAEAQNDSDERYATYARLAQIYEGLNRPAEAATHRRRSQAADAELQTMQQDLKSLLAQALIGLR